MIKKTAIAVIVLFTICGVVYYKTPSQKQKYINHVRDIANNKILKKSYILPGGEIVRGADKIESLGLVFNCYRRLTVDDARAMVVSCAEILLDSINDYEPIRPYLYKYPFPMNRIEIDIDPFTVTGSKIEDGKITLISLYDNVINYRTIRRNSVMPDIFLSETYEEAVEKLKLQHKSASAP